VLAAIAIFQIPIWGANAISKQQKRTWLQVYLFLLIYFAFFSISFLSICISKRFKASLQPTEEWGPKDPETKQQW